jgi:NADPH-dependent 2,4-dienoyl-CoA reductase/sulfur reductase-like enzyme
MASGPSLGAAGVIRNLGVSAALPGRAMVGAERSLAREDMGNDIATRVVIVGAGEAGGATAAFLRQHGFAGAITLLGEESMALIRGRPYRKHT